MNLKFISLNCNGLRSKHKRRAIFSFLKKERINIACLQETFITPADFDMWKREWGGEMFFTPGSHHSQVLIILLSRNLDVTSIITQRIGERILSLSLSYNEQDIAVLNVYGPNNDKDKQEFLTELENIYNTCMSPKMFLLQMISIWCWIMTLILFLAIHMIQK